LLSEFIDDFKPQANMLNILKQLTKSTQDLALTEIVNSKVSNIIKISDKQKKQVEYSYSHLKNFRNKNPELFSSKVTKLVFATIEEYLIDFLER